ncbi:hypothetical protein GGH12_003971 [Coemansia sp. RSA 1822]|nr:hypothetical protein LPJ76_003656 [Coemansia sp. RSA 638]KAJ2561441.1 hypothetical protein GGH12_003971 [Coemansia sp. RSA 1822]
MFVACAAVFTLLAFNTVILYTHPLYPTNMALRITKTLCGHVIANFLWWFIMFRSMYNCAVRQDTYLAEWKDKLVRDGLQKQYQIACTDLFSVTVVSVASSNVTKLVLLPQGMVTDHNGFKVRTSFSRHIMVSEHTPYIEHADDGLWRPESVRQHMNPAFLFSPHSLPSPVEHSSSTSTVSDLMTPLTHYDFLLPPKSA